jgi:hypothetical protein
MLEMKKVISLSWASAQTPTANATDARIAAVPTLILLIVNLLPVWLRCRSPLGV